MDRSAENSGDAQPSQDTEQLASQGTSSADAG
jgi:hypothetical protein